MTWFLSACFWVVLALLQFLAGLLFQALMGVLWLFWPIVVVGVLIATAQSAEAGWFSWLWGSNTRQLERSLEVAEEAARVASEASQAQAQQAAAQADQNARLAETLGQLSNERSNLADHLHALTELGLQDSQWAAALTAAGPVLVCVTVLLVAGLALWLANKSGEGQHAELAETVDLLVEEMAAAASEPRAIYGPRSDSPWLGHHKVPLLVGEACYRPAGDETAEEGDDPKPF